MQGIDKKWFGWHETISRLAKKQSKYPENIYQLIYDFPLLAAPSDCHHVCACRRAGVKGWANTKRCDWEALCSTRVTKFDPIVENRWKIYGSPALSPLCASTTPKSEWSRFSKAVSHIWAEGFYKVCWWRTCLQQSSWLKENFLAVRYTQRFLTHYHRGIRLCAFKIHIYFGIQA